MPATFTREKWIERAAEAAQIMKDAKALGLRGKRNNDPATARGTSTSYLASRIKRDRPDIAERVERGEFYSLRAAALAAGIIKHRERAA